MQKQEFEERIADKLLRMLGLADTTSVKKL